ncbi:hypothetical protein SteCoe_25628 [Stentor coeruleus]|uniref:Uncharacterized protein n=1 Tax=Stentor coeruleus TaxID=5963 RepID=A0A1R2BEW4_9CILI|nr:hypothetical protein SteCoe_25628 [Stentor coeruleus]
MGNNCSNSGSKVSAQGILITYDISKISKGVLRNQSKVLTSQFVNELILIFQSRLLKNPKDFYSNLHLGICLYKQGFYDIAESHLLTSLKTNETYTAYYILALIIAQRGRYEDCILCLENSIKCKENFQPAHIKKSEIYLKLNQLANAKKALRECKKIDPDNSDLHMFQALYYKAKIKLDKAEKYLEKAIRSSEELAKCYFFLAEIQQMQGKYQEAQENFSQAIMQAKGSFIGIIKISLALLNFEMEKFDLMLKALKESLQFGNHMSALINMKGFGIAVKDHRLLMAIQKYNRDMYFESILQFKVIFRENKKNVLAGYFLAMCYKHIKNIEKACHYFKKIIRYGKIQSSSLAVLIVTKAKNELDELSKNKEQDIEDTLEYVDSPLLPKLTVPEFLVSYHNFTAYSEPSVKRMSSCIVSKIHRNEEKVYRSVTPPRSTIKRIVNSANTNTEGCIIY